MRISRLLFVIAALICLLPLAAYPQGFSLGLGMGMGFGGSREIIRIGPGARETLHNYLVAEYNHECGPKVKKPADDCDETKALYTSSSISFNDSEPLPQDIARKIGFVYPGTEYVQAGYVVYLISLPRRIILDSVSVNDDTHRYFNKQ